VSNSEPTHSLTASALCVCVCVVNVLSQLGYIQCLIVNLLTRSLLVPCVCVCVVNGTISTIRLYTVPNSEPTHSLTASALCVCVLCSECPVKIFVNEDRMSTRLHDLHLDNNNLDWHPDLEREPWYSRRVRYTVALFTNDIVSTSPSDKQ